MLTGFIDNVGQQVIRILDMTGRYFIFTFRILKGIFTKKIKTRHVVEQMYKIGTKSLPITLITLMFVGMVFANQVAKEFTKIGAGKIIGGIIGFAVWRELGPLFAGVVVAARVGAAISTEIGAMKVTEQLDALRSMAINPLTYLYIPRFLGLVFMMPILIIFADCIGFLAGLVIYVTIYHGNYIAYFTSASQMLDLKDLYAGVIYKGPLFGFLIASIAIFIGANSPYGAVGIGKSATRTVVACLIALFIVNFFLSYLIFL